MLTFSFEGEVADLTDVRSHICMGPDVFLQHAWLLAADATLLTDVFPPTSTSYIHILLIGLVPER